MSEQKELIGKDKIIAELRSLEYELTVELPKALRTAAALGDLSSVRGATTISSLYALINAQVTIPSNNPQQPATIYNSPLGDTSSIKQFLPMILDKLTTKKDGNLPARVNINTAPSAVLAALAPNGTPLLDSSTVQSIPAPAMRPSARATRRPAQRLDRRAPDVRAPRPFRARTARRRRTPTACADRARIRDGGRRCS